MAGERDILGFDPARVEKELDEEQGELGDEVRIMRPDASGAELQDGREAHLEPPPSEKGYRNLNE